jgi:hypothetical protein
MNKPRIKNTFIVDGKIMTTWIGKKMPKWITFMSKKYKGCELLQEDINE